MELGKFNSGRIAGMFNMLNTDKADAYIASEYITTDGPFESPQNFKRINMFGKYTRNIGDFDHVGITMSYFTSKWDASGQIPQRAVDDGSITRFGAIDDTEGGETSRTNIAAYYKKYIDEQSFVKSTVFFSNYNFDLFSNFTFFLKDSINGDQIRQREKRNIYGFNSVYDRSFSTKRIDDGNWQAGIRLRSDQIQNSELSHTVNRWETLDQIQFGDINETNFGAFVNATFIMGKWTINPSLRLDHFTFQYNDGLSVVYQTQSTTRSIISPKFNLLYNHSRQLQLYIKTGKGFHSNDTRLAVAQSNGDILPAAYGTDLGFIWKPLPRLLVNLAYWYLFLEQEFVYVGDEGIVEPIGKTERQGVDMSIRYQPLDWLFWNLDVNYAYARATEEEEGEN